MEEEWDLARCWAFWQGYRAPKGEPRDLAAAARGDAQTPVLACLVGKGITFDTGGYSLKGSRFMDSMKSDMGGGATLTGALVLTVSRGLNKRVQLILCYVDNMVSGNAFKLGDIIHYRNGKSVEVINTDAEGCLVLADGLIDNSAA